jgi:HEAT repeat protein
MKKLLLATAFLAGGLLGLEGRAFAHGGQYRGPGDTVPPGGGGSGGGGGAGPSTGPAGPSSPGGAGPTTPGPGGPGAPGGGPGAGPVTGGPADSGPDLTLWSFWWEFNKEPYLNLKSHIHDGATETGTEGWFLGQGEKKQGKDNLKPTEEQIRQVIVPALLRALENETNNDIVTGCLIALAKIGDPASESGDSQFEPVIAKFLSDKNQEISETAAVALGILANPKSIKTLENLVRSTSDGQRLVGENKEVPYRTRAFAAYGLGLIGSRTGSEADRSEIVKVLRQVIESDSTSTRDLKVSCVIAMGLVPLATIETPPQPEPEGGKKGKEVVVPAEASRIAQLDYLLRFMNDEDHHFLVRAHCPTALARLVKEGLPEARYDEYRAKIAEELLGRLDKGKDQAELLQSCVLALGLMGTNDGSDALDKRIRSTLIGVPKDLSDIQARNYSMISLAKVGGTVGATDPDGGIGEVQKALLKQLSDGKSAIKPWAGLSCGVMVDKLRKSSYNSAAFTSIQEAVRAALKDEGSPANLGAYALSCGIMGDVEAESLLMKRLDSENDDIALGYVAVSLGLMNARGAIQKIQSIVEDAKYKPERLKQCAIALGLLGDKNVVPKLTELLGESRGLATQASLSSALGIIGDRRSIDPLVVMLENKDLTDRARGFAAVALGIVADKEPLPWNSKIALDLNYRASTQTLTDTNNGTGILDIL